MNYLFFYLQTWEEDSTFIWNPLMKNMKKWLFFIIFARYILHILSTKLPNIFMVNLKPVIEFSILMLNKAAYLNQHSCSS